MKYNIGVDIGGTNIKLGLVDDKGKVLFKVKQSTYLSNTGKKMGANINSLVYMLLEKAGVDFSSIDSVGVCCPGVVDVCSRLVECSFTFGWHGEDLLTDLEKKLNKHIYIENDANAAAIGEYIFRSDENLKNMVMLTLGTGIGGGVIVDGHIYRGFNFGGSEIGHMVIKKGGRQCSCGRKGCFERYASATGLMETTKEVIKKYNGSTIWDAAKNEDDITCRTIFDAAKLGDKAATEVLDIFIEDLAVGVINVINIFQPQLLVLGGGLSGEGEYIVAKLKNFVDKFDYARSLKKRCVLEVSKIGNDAGILGAAFCYKFL